VESLEARRLATEQGYLAAGWVQFLAARKVERDQRGTPPRRIAEYGHISVGEQPHRQESRARMSSAPRLVPKTLPSSMTLENSLAFLAFSAMTFSSIVSLATRR